MRKIMKKGMALASATIMIAGSMPMTAVSISAAENEGNQIAVQADSETAFLSLIGYTHGIWLEQGRESFMWMSKMLLGMWCVVRQSLLSCQKINQTP